MYSEWQRVLIFITTFLVHCAVCQTPVVLWHGMGDICCFPFSLGAVKNLIEVHIDGVYVKSLKIGGSIVEDYRSGFFINPNKQVEDACHQIANDQKLSKGFHAIGFSQGGQFLRAVAQRCPKPPMRSLITLGSQHQGVFGVPACPSLTKKSCERIRKLLNVAAYDRWVQEELVQSTYWHDPFHEEKYRNKSIFLADINNEVNVNENYIKNLRSLQKFVMVKFVNDTIVQPVESEWFGFYSPGQDRKIVPLRKSQIYRKDKLGLRQMDKENKLEFLECEGNHLQISAEYFVNKIIPYLRG